MEANGHSNGNGTQALTLRGWKQAKGFTWVWLCTSAAVSYPALMNWLRTGNKAPGFAKIRIAAALGITPDQIADTAPPESTEAPAIVPDAPQASADAVDRRVGGRRAADVA